MNSSTTAVSGTAAGPLSIEASLVERAKHDDSEAMLTMFGQFIPSDEPIEEVAYFGIQGWLLGRSSFACLTGRRTASLMIGAFGEVVYQDGYHEFNNSGIVYQPSRLWLFVIGVGIVAASTFSAFWLIAMDAPLLLALAAWALGVVLLVYWPKVFYRHVKCGLVLWIREGVSVYVFCNRNRIARANTFYRHVLQFRQRRVDALNTRGL